MKTDKATLRRLPSVDAVLRSPNAQAAIERFGRTALVAATRAVLDRYRRELRADAVSPTAGEVAAAALSDVEAADRAHVRPVFNLTGTILHTNLGRAVLAEEAIAAAVAAMRQEIALEFDLVSGRRGERDSLVRDLLCRLTGAEDATVVNNNAAAVLLVLNTLAKGREAVVSRGELIEIGGAFRLPDIMMRAGTRLVEVGTTNRTHPNDYAAALGPRTGLVLKVHPSNYRIEGFTKEVSTREIAVIVKAAAVPLVHDLGSGTLVDLTRYGLQQEPTVRASVEAGADLVTFSGDKLLGGPQAGFIVGRAELIARVNRNPMKRALRVDKIRLAAIEATLRLYGDPDRLAMRLPVLRRMSRSEAGLREMAARLRAPLATALGEAFGVDAVACASEIGSGALPQQTIPSFGLGIRPNGPRGAGRRLSTLSASLRRLPVPVIGRIADGTMILDLRCLDDEPAFLANLAHLDLRATESS